MKLTGEGDWLETGEFSPDGATWLKTLEIKLRHVRKE